MGPCSIAKKWAPYEISIVSVPADPTVGVGREMEEKSEPGTQDIPLDIYERQLQINKNRMDVKENEKQTKYIALLYNAILGGTPTSKLFQNVREKENDD